MKFILSSETSEGIVGLDEKRSEKDTVEEVVNSFLVEKDYGLGVVQFMLVLKLLLPEHAAFWPSGQIYRPRRKEVLFNPTLDPFLVVKTSEVEWYRMICEEILKAVLRFPEVKVRNFDHLALYKDLESLFKEKGWL